MLNIITGRTGSGKTRYIRDLAKQIAENEGDKAIIIVPEQFSFETERGMLELLGNEKMNNVKVLSFSLIAETLLTSYGKITKKPADDATRAVLMSMAIDSLQDKISFYNKYKKNPTLIKELLKFNRELKTCCIPSDKLSTISSEVSKPSFAKKLDELSVIFQCYEALMIQSFQDDSLYLDMLADLLLDVPFFKEKTVFIDAFSGFSAQEYKIIERIIATAENVYITFCCDTKRNNGEYELFYNTMCEIRKLREIANRLNVKIAPERVLYSQKEYKADALNFLEDNLFDITEAQYDKSCDSIALVPCRNKNEECDYVAAEIKRLAREEGYRYRNIAVIERSEGDYKQQLMSSFRKYGIDCFPDNRQPILSQPLMAFMLSLFDILGEGFKTEYVLRFLKTGLYGFTIEEISLIEDYALMWGIKSGEWKNEWKSNPDGFGYESNEASDKKLALINELRTRIVGPILSLKARLVDKTGDVISKELFDFLRNAEIDENLKAFTALLIEKGEDDLALEQGKIWKILTEILDSLSSATEGAQITLKRYRELFEIIVSTKDLGQIPNGMDEVIIGSADRIKATAPKAVFIMGANSGVFPRASSSGVILNNAERCELQNKGIELVSNLEYNSVTENFIAYHAMTLATDKLYVLYSGTSTGGEALSPSELVLELKRIYGENITETIPSPLDFIESHRTAYSALAGEKNKNSQLGSTLYALFEKNGSENELSMLEKLGKKDFRIQDSKLATNLFGESMYISASKTERFYKCPFSYFCEYGIKAKPRREAQMDPAQSGSLVHELLEIFLRNNPKVKLVTLSNDEIKRQINDIIDDYVVEKLSGYENQPQSFARTIDLLKESSFKLIIQLIDEFAHCEFTPVNFELSINNDGDVKPYEISLNDNASVKLIGKVDRVDAYETDDNTFIRIIDYKTGGKDFNLGEVFAGLNMQMLIYLFAIWQNGGDLYKNVTPAGILYFQAKAPRATATGKLTRHSDELAVSKSLKDKFRMSGMVLNNVDVISAMEKNMEGVYIPAVMNEDGTISGNVISMKSLTRLKNKVDDIIRQMAFKLHKGEIPAFPTETGCNYCQYNDICKHDSTDSIREFDRISFTDAVSMLGGDENE